MSVLTVATWNVNSVRARLERLLAWLDKVHPDVLCLQELKGTEDKFPFDEIKAAGYNAAMYGQKSYNGVAVLARSEITDVKSGFGDDSDPQARLIAVTVEGVRIISAYFPNGGEVGSDKWTYKLGWMKRLGEYLKTNESFDQPLLVCGDSNVALSDTDVAEPDRWANTVLCHEESRGGLREVMALGLEDTYAVKNPGGTDYSWWDYRSLGFQRGDGLRIDHIFATKPMVERCEKVWIDRDERKGQKPSDHAPVIAEFK